MRCQGVYEWPSIIKYNPETQTDVSHLTFHTDRQCFHIWECTCDLMKRTSSIWKDNVNLRKPIGSISNYMFNFNNYFIFCVSIVSVWVST